MQCFVFPTYFLHKNILQGTKQEEQEKSGGGDVMIVLISSSPL